MAGCRVGTRRGDPQVTANTSAARRVAFPNSPIWVQPFLEEDIRRACPIQPDSQWKGEDKGINNVSYIISLARVSLKILSLVQQNSMNTALSNKKVLKTIDYCTGNVTNISGTVNKISEVENVN